MCVECNITRDSNRAIIYIVLFAIYSMCGCRGELVSIMPWTIIISIIAGLMHTEGIIVAL